MNGKHMRSWCRTGFLPGVLILAGALSTALAEGPPAAAVDTRGGWGGHVDEVLRLLTRLEVGAPRTYENMAVFPIRYTGRQAPGRWATLDESVARGELRISEKEEASVPEVLMENTGDKTIFVMSGEIVKGGKQTRVVRKDTIIEARQKVRVPVFCVERSRWHGGARLEGSAKMVPARMHDMMKRGSGQGVIWDSVEEYGDSFGVQSPTGSLDELLDSDRVQRTYDKVHEGLGKFTFSDTVGIAVADMRTRDVVGLEVFGRRDLFERLQEKLIEGYATDLVLGGTHPPGRKVPRVTEEKVLAFIQRAIRGRSTYEDTPGSGRGIDLVAGTLRGKGVASGRNVIHLSIQDRRPVVTPARPIVDQPRRSPALQSD